MGEIDRRTFLASAAAAAAAAGLPAEAEAGRRRRRKRRRPKPKPKRPPSPPEPPIGAGGTPMTPEALQSLAARVGQGESLCFVDLAAFDQNFGVVTSFAAAQGWAVRPALKSFESPGFIAYTLERLREPRGLIFHLRQVEEIVAVAPAGVDLMTGYPPSVGELAAWLGRPALKKSHRVRVLVDSPELLQALADLTRTAKRPLPVEVAFQLESGFFLSGFRTPEQLSDALRTLRGARDRLQLTAVLCYDGYGSFNASKQFRQTMVADCSRRWQAWMDQLAAEGGDLYDAGTLVRNGPASSSYQLWAGNPLPNEISPGTAFLFAGYLTGDGYENEGLAPVLWHAGPVNRLPGAARMPLTGLPEGTYESIGMKGGAWPTHEGDADDVVVPSGTEDDTTHGGRGNNSSHLLAQPGHGLKRGDYVVLKPKYAGDAIDYFDTVVAIRDGEVKRVWPTLRRPGLPAPARPVA